MRQNGFSLVEVMVAAAVVAVGLTAAAVLIGTLMTQEEINASSLRASNIQEQAVRLYRFDLPPSEIVALLPENCAVAATPPSGGYAFIVSRPLPTNVVVDGTTVNLDLTSLAMVFADSSPGGGNQTNAVTILRPATRVRYAQ